MNVSSLSGNALLVKSKVMNSGRITDKQYSEMCALSDIAELGSYLKSRTAYFQAFEGLTNVRMSRTRLEGVIRRMVYLRESRLMRYTSLTGSGLEDYFIKRMEADMIISSARHTESMFAVNPYLLYIPEEIKRSVELDLVALENSRSPMELLDALRGTEYYNKLEGVLTSSERSFVHVQNILYGSLFENTAQSLKKHLSASDYSEAIDELSLLSDVLTLSAIYRTKKYYVGNERMLMHIFTSSLSRIDKNKFGQLCACPDVSSFKKMVDGSKYGKLFKDNYDSHNLSRRVLFKSCIKKLSRSQNSVVCAICYDELVRIEASNISTVAEGLAYKMRPDEISQLLIKE